MIKFLLFFFYPIVAFNHNIYSFTFYDIIYKRVSGKPGHKEVDPNEAWTHILYFANP